MSRIIRPRVDPGDTIDATTLNDTYDDYSQSGGLNQFNTRDQAFDLPHFNTDVQLIQNTAGPALLGAGEKAHPGASGVVVNALSSGTTLHPISDGAGSPAVLDMTADPFVLASGDCLRVWWNLSMEPRVSGRPDTTGMGTYAVDELGGAGTVVIGDGFHFWLCWLQWDITSAALTNFTAVPNQTDIQSGVFSGYNGIRLDQMAASTAISHYATTSFGFADAGKMPTGNTGQLRDHGFFAPYSMYVHAPGSPVTVYGLRIVLAGLFHSRHDAATGVNYAALDYAAAGSQQIAYTSGRIQAVQMKMS